MGAVSSEPVTLWRLPAVTISAKHRATPAHFLSEVIATAGLLLVIFALARSGRSRSAPAAVGAYIGAAYFFAGVIKAPYPAMTLADAADIIFPHHGDAGQAPARASHDGASPSADRPPGPVSLTRQPEGACHAPGHDRRQRRRDQRGPAGP